MAKWVGESENGWIAEWVEGWMYEKDGGGYANWWKDG
jgi:hypothetical protein